MKRTTTPLKSRVVVAAGLGLAMIFSLGACANAPQGEASSGEKTDFAGQTLVVTVYGGETEKFVREQVVPDFEEQTGATVELAAGTTKDWVPKIRIAGVDGAEYDVVTLNKIRLPGLKSAGFFEKLPMDKVPNLKDMAPQLRDPDDIGVQGLFQPVGFGYRTDLIETPPASWKELWSPEYDGKLCLYDPSNAGGIMSLMTMGELFGGGTSDMDTAFEKLEQLEPFKQSSFDMQTPLTRGECEIAIIDSPAAMDLKEKGAPIDWVIPNDGTFMMEQDMNVASGSEVKDLAFAYVNYLLSPAVQEKWANEFYVSPGNVKAKISPESAPMIPITADDMSDLNIWTEEELAWVEDTGSKLAADRWNREVG